MVSHQYTEMCKATEIQGQWTPRVGDMVLFESEIYYIISHPVDDICEISHWNTVYDIQSDMFIVQSIKKLTWLPYQHQIQELFKMGTSQLWSQFQEFTHYFAVLDDDTDFDEFWLQTFMYRIHNKRWLNFDWIMEK
jgi:hypothetical protein